MQKISKYISEDNFAGDSILKCAHCSDIMLHQETVHTFNRSEDEPTYHVAIDQGNGKLSTTTLLDNPSPRRQGLSVVFACELCQGHTKLNIFQHKGNTFLECRIN